MKYFIIYKANIGNYAPAQMLAISLWCIVSAIE